MMSIVVIKDCGMLCIDVKKLTTDRKLTLLCAHSAVGQSIRADL